MNSKWTTDLHAQCTTVKLLENTGNWLDNLGFEDDFFRTQDPWYDPWKEALVNWASLKLKALHCKDTITRRIRHSLGGYICKIHIS